MGCGDLVEGYLLLMRDDLVLLAVGASFYVIGYPSTHSCPVVCLACLPNSFVSPGVSGCGVVVYEHHQLSFGCFGRCCEDSFDK